MRIIAFAFLCIALGVWPEPIYRLLPYPVDYVSYTAAHVLTQLELQLQLPLFSGLAFLVMLPWLKRTPTLTLDFDWTYRVLLPALIGRAASMLRRLPAVTEGVPGAAGRRLQSSIYRHHGPEGGLARSWPTGSMALWVMVLLLSYLLLYYV